MGFNHFVKDVRFHLLCEHQDCIYAGKLSGNSYCNFMQIRGRQRGCKPNFYCVEYVPGKYVGKVQGITLKDDWRLP